jgi:hypothetical protein
MRGYAKVASYPSICDEWYDSVTNGIDIISYNIKNMRFILWNGEKDVFLQCESLCFRTEYISFRRRNMCFKSRNISPRRKNIK